jgi:exonuclease SbcC
MKLLSLKLLNFRRFRQEEIVFKDNFSLIFWKNWAWKSSIIDAIWYALFWPIWKDFVRVNATFLKSFFVTDRLPSKIELTFSVWLETYRIVRVIDAWIKKLSNDFIPETKDSLFWANWLEIIWWWEVNDFIIKLIWVSKDTFLRSVFAKQKDLEVLSGMAQNRKDLINSILWLDKIQNIISELKKEEKEKINLLTFTKSRVSEINIDEIKILQKTKKEEEKTILEKLKQEENNLKILNEKFENIKKNYELQDKKRQEKESLENQIKIITNSIEREELELKRLDETLVEIAKKEKYLLENKEIIEKEKKYSQKLNTLLEQKNLFDKKKTLEERQKTLSEKLAEINKNLEDLLIPPWERGVGGFSNQEKFLNISQNIQELEKSAELEQKKFDSLNEEKINLESKINYLRKEYDELKKELENVKSLSKDATCPTCLRPLESHFPTMLKLYEDKLLEKANEWKKEKLVLEEKANILQNILKNLEKIKNDLALLKQKELSFTKFSENKKIYLEDLEKIKIDLENFKDVDFKEEIFIETKKEYEEIKIRFSEYRKLEWEVANKKTLEENKKTAQEKIKDFSIKKEEILKKLSEIWYDEENYLKVKEEFLTSSTFIKEKTQEISVLNNEKIKKDYELKELNEKLENFKKDNENIKNLASDIEYSSLKIKILWDYIIYLLEYLKPKIEDLASEYFSIITDYKYNYITLDNDYNILIDGKNIDLFSWWERDLANLCLRLSLGQNLSLNRWNPINFLVLDEVLWSQDKERQQNILTNLKKLEHKFSQIILISHLEEIKDLATNLIEVRALNKEESEVLYY